MNATSKILAAVGAVGILATGGWVYAAHHATAVTRDRVDGFLIRNELSDKIRYADISASPLGSAKLSGVTVAVSPDVTVSIGSLEISDVEISNDQLVGVSLATDEVEVPSLAIVQAQRSRRGWLADPDLTATLGLGYTVLRGRIDLAAHYDEENRTLQVESVGSVRDAGGWKVKLRLADVQRGVIELAHRMVTSSEAAGQLQLAALSEGMQALSAVTLAELDLTLDNVGIVERSGLVTDRPLPPGDGAEAPVATAADEEALVKAGMTPSAARDTREAFEGWLTRGGSLRISSDIGRPVPLMDPNLPAPSSAFRSLPGYLAQTRSQVSF